MVQMSANSIIQSNLFFLNPKNTHHIENQFGSRIFVALHCCTTLFTFPQLSKQRDYFKLMQWNYSNKSIVQFAHQYRFLFFFFFCFPIFDSNQTIKTKCVIIPNFKQTKTNVQMLDFNFKTWV